METKLRRHLKLGQVWRYPIYRSGMSDNELVGYVYYVLHKKQSGGMWKLLAIASEPKELQHKHKYLSYGNYWTKSTEILKYFEQVDPEPFKTAVVLFA